MTGARILSLFSGYGGLDMAVAAVLGGEVIAHAEIEPAARAVLEHRFPGVPNLGDVTAVDWSAVGPVDVICGGFPCQDVSLAGRRLGIAHDTRSGLWGHMAAAVDSLRPSLVVIENVRGLLSARAQHPAHRDVEPCPWCLAGPDDVSLRALGAVLGDLADLGYDAAWRTVAAADVGAPHGRARVFVIAWPTADTSPGGRGSGEPDLRRRESDAGRDTDPDAAFVGCGPAWGDDRLRTAGLVGGAAANTDRVGPPQPAEPGTCRRAGGEHGPRSEAIGACAAVAAAENTEREPRDERRLAAPGETEGRQARADAGGRGRAPAADPDGAGLGGVAGSPAGRDGVRADVGGDPDRRDRAAAAVGSASAADPVGGGRDRGSPDPVGGPGGGAAAAGDSAGADRWGPYGPAVGRWEAVLGHPAPPPTEPNARGAHRLSPRFVEWMMGLPAGWVCDVPGIGRNDALRLLGNGVVPQQAAAAVAGLLRAVADMAAPPTCGEVGGAA